jgi:hypothetical protein
MYCTRWYGEYYSYNLIVYTSVSGIQYTLYPSIVILVVIISLPLHGKIQKKPNYIGLTLVGTFPRTHSVPNLGISLVDERAKDFGMLCLSCRGGRPGKNEVIRCCAVRYVTACTFVRFIRPNSIVG